MLEYGRCSRFLGSLVNYFVNFLNIFTNTVDQDILPSILSSGHNALRLSYLQLCLQ